MLGYIYGGYVGVYIWGLCWGIYMGYVGVYIWVMLGYIYGLCWGIYMGYVGVYIWGLCCMLELWLRFLCSILSLSCSITTGALESLL